MRVDARVEQLDVYPNSVTSLLHGAFEHTGDAEFASHCLQVFWLAFVFGCGRTRDHLQVADASELGQDFILNAVSEIGISFFLAKVLERQYSNRFFRRLSALF